MVKTVCEFARRIVESSDLEIKLSPPRELIDEDRGDGVAPTAPGRPANLTIVPGREAKVPPLAGWKDPAQRLRIIHALANHELQATELFAWALIAYPEAPDELRRDWLSVLSEEQVHTRLYLLRLQASGGQFGDYPVSGLFWNRIMETRNEVEFLCALSLTFENANLDHAPEAAEFARRCGDHETAKILERVAKDEEGHVAIGMRWLERLSAPFESQWEAYRRHLHWPLHPGRARGEPYRREPRRRAGLDEEFIENLSRVSNEVAEHDRNLRSISPDPQIPPSA